jgi:hypothetical protein
VVPLSPALRVEGRVKNAGRHDAIKNEARWIDRCLVETAGGEAVKRVRMEEPTGNKKSSSAGYSFGAL